MTHMQTPFKRYTTWFKTHIIRTVAYPGACVILHKRLASFSTACGVVKEVFANSTAVRKPSSVWVISLCWCGLRPQHHSGEPKTTMTASSVFCDLCGGSIRAMGRPSSQAKVCEITCPLNSRVIIDGCEGTLVDKDGMIPAILHHVRSS